MGQSAHDRPVVFCSFATNLKLTISDGILALPCTIKKFNSGLENRDKSDKKAKKVLKRDIVDLGFLIDQVINLHNRGRD
ncbi:MAG TPA: hypothetical protein VIS49_13575 [Cyclobacteriaceae bacterium]